MAAASNEQLEIISLLLKTSEVQDILKQLNYKPVEAA